jgi:hypothetical protein
MKRTVAAKDDKKAARLLRSKTRTGAAEPRETDPDGVPPGPVFPASRGMRCGAVLSYFADSAVATRAAA